MQRTAIIALWSVLTLCCGAAVAADLPKTAPGAAPKPLPPVNIPSTQPPLPVPQGAAGQGLYIAGSDRVGLGGTQTSVARLNLPRGTYEVIARAVVANDRDADGAANCSLRAGGAEIDYVSITLPPNSRREYMLLGVASVSSPVLGQVEMFCSSTPEAAATARWARIFATIVPSVTGSVPAGN